MRFSEEGGDHVLNIVMDLAPGVFVEYARKTIRS